VGPSEPPSEVRWIDPHGWTPWSLASSGVYLVFAWTPVAILERLYGSAGLTRVLEHQTGGPSHEVFLEAVVAIIAAIGFSAIGVLRILTGRGVRVGLGPEGLTVVSRFKTTPIGWRDLGPATSRPTGNWAVFQRGDPTEQRTSPVGFAFWATKEQGRAILSDPRLDSRRFPPSYWVWAGLPIPRA
jgi:hypothetical protein